MPSKSKIALVTGAGTGVGRAASYGLLEAGFVVVFIGRRKSVLDAAIEDSPDKSLALAIECDVTQAHAVEAMFMQVEKEFGRLDVLFNNAGAALPSATIDEISLSDWERILAVNVTGSFLCARAAFKLMRQQNPMGGRIINNGSVSAYSPRPGSVPYTTTKHAISGLTKSLSLDGRAYNIAASQVDIGNAASDMAMPLAEGALQASGNTVPEPLMDLAHVSDAIVQMASLPLSANVQQMTIMATKMPFVGRG